MTHFKIFMKRVKKSKYFSQKKLIYLIRRVKRFLFNLKSSPVQGQGVASAK